MFKLSWVRPWWFLMISEHTLQKGPTVTTFDWCFTNISRPFSFSTKTLSGLILDWTNYRKEMSIFTVSILASLTVMICAIRLNVKIQQITDERNRLKRRKLNVERNCGVLLTTLNIDGKDRELEIDIMSDLLLYFHKANPSQIVPDCPPFRKPFIDKASVSEAL